MCAIDDGEMAKLWDVGYRQARFSHGCDECKREIKPREHYRFYRWLDEYGWGKSKTCVHCVAAEWWMQELCGGNPLYMLLEELEEHRDDAYDSVINAYLIFGVSNGWLDGSMEIPNPADLIWDVRDLLNDQAAA